MEGGGVGRSWGVWGGRGEDLLERTVPVSLCDFFSNAS